MKTKKVTTIGITALLFACGPLFARWASAADAGAEDAGAAGAAPSVGDISFPEEKSPRPGFYDWKKEGQPLALSPGSYAPGCKVLRIREWVRIRCDTTLAQVALVGGNHEGVLLNLDPVTEDWQFFPDGGEIVFPVRRGDRRVFELLGVEWGYKGANTATSFLVISESWLPGDAAPEIFAK